MPLQLGAYRGMLRLLIYWKFDILEILSVSVEVVSFVDFGRSRSMLLAIGVNAFY